MRAIRLVQLLLLGATLGLFMPIARAAPATSAHRVEVSAAGCDRAALYFDRVVELLRVELSAFDVEVVAAPTVPGAAVQEATAATRTISRVQLSAGAELTDARAPCQVGATGVTVRVEQASFAGPAAQRHLELSDVAIANRPRTLAIAAAELLQASWSNSAASPGSAVSAAPAAPAAPAKTSEPGAPRSANRSRVTPQPALQREPGVWIEAGVLARAFPSGGTALLGPELNLSVPLASVLTLNLSGEVSSGVASLPFDDANGPSASVSATTATLSCGPGLRSRGPVALEISPRIGVGDGRLASQFHGRTADRLLVFVSFEAMLRAQLLAGWASFAGIEVGRTLSGVLLESGETPLTSSSVELNGVLVGARIGLSFALTHRR